MSNMVEIKITDIFTEKMLREAKNKDINYIFNNIITENVMSNINKKTGQENDRKYMSYLLQFWSGKLND